MAAKGPLQGIKVLDFTRFQNGPSATRCLADYGADVIKVEAPRGGDEMRMLTQGRDGFNAGVQFTNRGKRSLTLDIRKPEAKPVMERLIKWADVITENYKPGTFDRYGYTYEYCSRLNPGIILCANSGYGSEGPMGHRGSFDGVAQAFTGVMFGQGGGADSKPQPVDFAFSDEIGAMSFVQGILMAIIHKARTGEGQRMDTSQVGATIQFQGPMLTSVMHLDGRQADNKYPGYAAPKALGNQYICADGKYLQLQTTSQKRLSVAIGREDVASDPRMKDLRTHGDWFCAEMAKTFLTRPRDEWLTLIDETNTGPAGPVHTYKEMMDHPQTLANGYVVRREVKGTPGEKPGGELVVGKPLKFSKSPAGPVEKGPELGEHNLEVLHTLGFSQAEVDALESAQVIKPFVPGQLMFPKNPDFVGPLSIDANDDTDRPARLSKTATSKL